MAKAPALPIVITCTFDRVVTARITGGLRARAVVRPVESYDQVRSALRMAKPALGGVIISPEDFGGGTAEVIALVRYIRAEWPNVPIVACCHPGNPYSSQIRALSLAGVHEFLFIGVDDETHALRSLFDAAGQECAAQAVLDQIKPFLPMRLHYFCEYALAHPKEAASVAAIAKLLGTHRTTISRYCEQEQLPPPTELLSWCRLLLVAHLLEHTHKTVESMAIELGYPTATALRNKIKRYTGLRAGEIRNLGGVSLLLERFRSRFPQAAQPQAAAS